MFQEIKDYQGDDGYLYPGPPLFDIMLLCIFSIFFPVTMFLLLLIFGI